MSDFPDYEAAGTKLQNIFETLLGISLENDGKQDVHTVIAKAVVDAALGDEPVHRHRGEHTCLNCGADVDACIHTFVSQDHNLQRCCAGCNHSEFVKVYDPKEGDE